MIRVAAMLGLGLLGLASGGRAPAAEASTAGNAPVVLPPMLVEESKSGVPWNYVRVGGTEFLSRCSEFTTAEFVDAWLARMQLVRALVPEAFLQRTDVPSVCVLYAQDLDQTFTAEIQRELQDAPKRKGGTPDGQPVNIAPNMRLGDRDMHATIVYIDEAMFLGANLNIAPSHLRYLVQQRVPEPPAWLVEGLERLWSSADWENEPITLRPLVWQSQHESEELAAEPTRPRALLPASELFAADPRRAEENQSPRRVHVRLAQQELFVRWALTSGRETRAALWRFASRAAVNPVTEEMFAECFGFDFSELRDRLSDYLPIAAGETAWIDPGPLPPVPRFTVKRATPNEIARVRGEWERLAIWHVQRRLPAARGPYIAQARRTLRRAYDAGDRDPRLLAIMGFCELEAGGPAEAREFLEAAIAGDVVRPSVYYEVAKARFADLRRTAPDTQRFSRFALGAIIRPLQQALAQAPPLPEVFSLLAEAWMRCEDAPSPAELSEIARGAEIFPRRPTVALPIAQVLSRHGQNSEAARVLAACAGYATDEKTQAGITRLRAELAARGQPQAAP